jgi:hypothetical protein
MAGQAMSDRFVSRFIDGVMCALLAITALGLVMGLTMAAISFSSSGACR